EVATLFVATGQSLWGLLMAGQDEVALHDQREQGDIDLINYAAVQTLLAQLTGQAIAPDGDLLRYQTGEPLSPRTAPSQAWRALLTIQGALGVTPAQIEQDLKLEKRFEFEQSVTYRRLYQLAERRGLKPAREQLPDIELHSPKISRTLTTAWFADRCEARYRACLARDPYAAAGSVQPASTPAAPPPASSDPRP
ncbi:MAG TPA: DUF1615 family protein, partial [Burkholderiaceae bacterium]|nr:DUF1615 family protein [Burkholderiaceae bacterium]